MLCVKLPCVETGTARNYNAMQPSMAWHNAECRDLLERAGRGEKEAVGELFERHRERLRRMVVLRMDRRLQGRLDASDVLQEAFVEFARSVADYARNPETPVLVWLRLLTGRKLQALHRRHLGTKVRDAGREISLQQGPMLQASSQNLAEQLLGHFTSPSEAANRAELQIRVQDALNTLDPIDREVLALRHYEQLSNLETAQVLELSEAAASNRFVRAVKRLKKILEDPGTQV
jgi:RNA polymerase sigma-70 factor (ECF subfamily)